MPNLSEPDEQNSHPTILIVEDEPLLRGAVSVALRRRGLGVIEVPDGSTALKVIREPRTKIDLILLDIYTPGASVDTVAEEALQSRPKIKLVLTSGYDEELTPLSLNSIRAAAYIRKPFHLQELTGLLMNILAD